MNSTYSNGSASKRPPRPLSSRLAAKTTPTTSSMEISARKNSEECLTNSSKSTSAVQNANYQKCI
jgi:hypothetical protein